MSSSFKDHELTGADKLWLEAVYRDVQFDPKTAKVRLWDRLPKGFDPKKIDRRFLLNGKKLTILGIWIVDSGSPMLRILELVIFEIREIIFNQPGIETITAEKLSTVLQLPEAEVQKVLGYLSDFGGFFSSASGSSDSVGFSSISLTGDNAYNAYLEFQGLESLMQQYYERYSEPFLASVQGRALSDSTNGTKVTLLQDEIKKGTAFVLMPMDPQNAELVDVYETIKQVCACFGIDAYRADEIEHQGRITDRILSEIRLCEFLIADLSYKRPNVYYEIGYAHALQKRPILYRKHGTPLHFDLLVHNVPQYQNMTELKHLLSKRFEAILGRSPASPSTLRN